MTSERITIACSYTGIPRFSSEQPAPCGFPANRKTILSQRRFDQRTAVCQAVVTIPARRSCLLVDMSAKTRCRRSSEFRMRHQPFSQPGCACDAHGKGFVPAFWNILAATDNLLNCVPHLLVALRSDCKDQAWARIPEFRVRSVRRVRWLISRISTPIIECRSPRGY